MRKNDFNELCRLITASAGKSIDEAASSLERLCSIEPQMPNRESLYEL